MLRVTLDRNDIDGLRLVGVHIDRESEVSRQVPTNLVPGLAGIVAAQDVPVLLHEQHVRTGRMHRDAVDAVADLSIRVGELILGLQAAVRRPPRLAGVVGPEHACGRDSNIDASWIARVLHDRVQAHPAGTWLPEVPFRAAQSGKLLPRLPPAVRANPSGAFPPAEDQTRTGK